MGGDGGGINSTIASARRSSTGAVEFEAKLSFAADHNALSVRAHALASHARAFRACKYATQARARSRCVRHHTCCKPCLHAQPMHHHQPSKAAGRGHVCVRDARAYRASFLPLRPATAHHCTTHNWWRSPIPPNRQPSPCMEAGCLRVQPARNPGPAHAPRTCTRTHTQAPTHTPSHTQPPCIITCPPERHINIEFAEIFGLVRHAWARTLRIEGCAWPAGRPYHTRQHPQTGMPARVPRANTTSLTPPASRAGAHAHVHQRPAAVRGGVPAHREPVRAGVSAWGSYHGRV